MGDDNTASNIVAGTTHGIESTIAMLAVRAAH
jgi:hypothetical protein